MMPAYKKSRKHLRTLFPEAMHRMISKKRVAEYLSLKRRLSLIQCGNNPDPFMRDTLAPLITPDMDVYKDLEIEIFGDDSNGGNTNG